MKTRNSPPRSTLLTALVICLAGLTSPAASLDQEKLASGTNAFAFNLLSALAKEGPGENVFISPYSVSAALQIVCNGAEGETKKEMGEVLGSGSLSAKDASTAFQQLTASLKQASS